MRRLVVFATLVAAAVMASSAGAITAPPTNYSDPAGDAGTAPDITGVSVTNDDHGLVTFTIKFAAAYAADATVDILIDADQNVSTGDPVFGAEYDFVDDHSTHSYELLTWDGTSKQWVEAPHTTTNVTVADDSLSITMQVNKSEIANSSRFDFTVITSDGTFDSGHVDTANNGGDWLTYALQEVFTLSPGAFQDGPAKAGGTWTVSMTALRSDNGQALASGASVTCAAKEGTKKLAVQSSSFGNTRAVCTFRLPKKPKNAKVSATVTVSDAGESATKTFTATTH